MQLSRAFCTPGTTRRGHVLLHGTLGVDAAPRGLHAAVQMLVPQPAFRWTGRCMVNICLMMGNDV